MPAGRGKTCESCYWTGLLTKRVTSNLAGFSSPRIQQHFEAYSQWLLSRTGPHKAALTINGYYAFFAKLDEHWGEVPPYDHLLAVFGAARLRKAENPMRWLQDIGAVSVSAKMREEHSEQRRVSELLSELPDFWSKQLLHGYYSSFNSRIESNEVDVRSVRMALRSAVNFLKLAALSPQVLPTMKALEAFWRSSPGQVAAVTGFVGYLNKVHNTQLQTRPERKWLEKAKRDKAERELVALLKEDVDFLSEAMWISKALIYFHNIRRVSRHTLEYRPESFNGVAGFNVEHEGKVLWVPSARSYLNAPTDSRITAKQPSSV